MPADTMAKLAVETRSFKAQAIDETEKRKWIEGK